MKKFILSMLLAVLMLPFATRADELVIGNGTGSGYYSPFNNYYKHSWNETIYQASEFDGSVSINSIAYHCASTDKTVNATSVKIYMGETTKSEFASSSDWTPESDLTLVYEGSSIVLGDTEWEEFVLDQPFVYSGVNNLVVVVAKSASNYNSSLKWYYTDYGNKPNMYLQSDYSASYAEYPTQSGVQYAYSPDIKINYVTVPSGPVAVTPDFIDLGARPNGAWMRPAEVTIKPLGAYSNVNAIETTNAYFEMSDVELPTTIYNNNPLTMEVTHGEGEGEINGQLAIFYKDERGIEFADMTAFAYDPVANDVWETAETINGYSFTDTPTGVYDNYLLPGETPDGEDVVYKVTFNEDVLLTANVDGADPKVAIYGEDFGGEPGPGATNFYEGIEISDTPAGPSAAWLKYDNGTFYTAIGVGAAYSFYWAVKFTPEDLQDYAGTSLTRISMYDYAAHTGTFLIYKGGESAPQTQVGYQSYVGTGASAFVNYELEYPVAIDATQPLWIIAVNNQGVDYPAAASTFTGNPNGSWCSTDGYTWLDVADPTMLGSPLTWMIRGYVSADAKGETVYKPLEIKPQNTGGKLASAMSLDNTRGRGNEGINGMIVPAGTYYLAASSTSEFTVNVNAESIPVPAKPFNPNPTHMAQDIQDQLLTWEFGDYTLEYQLLFGTAYPPREVVVDWTNELTSAYSAVDLYNNKNYFWQVNVRNTSGTTYGDIWAFTTSFNIPTIVDITSNKLYPGESTTIGWNAVQDRSYRGYNVYVNGVKDNNTLVTETSYTVEGLEYNMEGHEITVTAVYDEGESAPSNVARVYVTGNGIVDGSIYELDSITPIAGGTIAITGTDAFGNNQTYNFTIDANGKFGGELLEGNYQAVATIENYQNGKAKFEVLYEETTEVNIIMTEVYTPVAYVEATELGENQVQVVWGMQYYGGPVEDFETGDFSANEWNNAVSSYPWEIVPGGCESDYAMKSTCEGVQNGISAIEITVEVPYDGIMGFNYKVSSEQAWDLGNFYIDGVSMMSASGQTDWLYKQVEVAEGTHTYRWEFSKDSSDLFEVGDDAFFIDNITFYAEKEPFAGGWLHYDDGVYATSIGTGSPSPCYWGVTFPASEEYAGYTINKVAVYDASPDYAGTYTANIYVGGTDGPGTLVSSQAATLTGVGDFVEIELSTPVTIDGTQPFWVTFYTADITYPAAGCAFVNLNSDWISLDGATWNHASIEYGLSYTWMVRAYLGNAKGQTAMLTTSSNAPKFEGGASTGTFVAAENVTPKYVGVPANETAEMGNRALSAYNVFRKDVLRNDEVALVEHLADTAYLDTEWSTIEASVYQWGVQAYYEGNRVVEETEAINEGFEGGTMPQGWTTIDEGTSLSAPWIVAALSGAGNFYPYEGTFAAYSAGSSAGGNYYLITPVINTDGLESATISFQYINPAWAGDNNDLEVAISSTPTGPWTSVWSSNGATSTWSEATIEVTDYTDSEMYVAFISIDGWGYCTAIDNVLVNVVTNKGGSEVVWSKPLEKDMTATVGVSVTSNTEDPLTGTKVTFVNLIEEGVVFTATLDETGSYIFNDFRKGTYEMTVEKSGYESNVVGEVVEIWDNAMFTAELTEDLAGVEGLYVSPTGWAMWQGGAVGAGDSFAYSFEDGMEGWTTIDANSDGHSWYHNSAAGDHGTLSSDSHTGAGHLMSESYCNATWTSMEPDDYIVSPSQVAIGGSSVLKFWACAQDVNYQAEHFGVAISTGSNTSAADFTTVSEWTIGAKVDAKGAVRGSRDATPWVQYEVDLSEYAGQSAWIAIRHFGCYDQFILLVDDIELNGGAKDNRALEGYTIMLDDAVVAEDLAVPYFQHTGLTDGTEYTTTVISHYTSGDSEPMEYTWTKAAEEIFAPVKELTASVEGETVQLSWVLPSVGGDDDNQGQTFNYGFESGTDGWTTINANGDDHTWYHNSAAGDHSVLSADSHGGTGHMMSESYCNATWASMQPDDYLVSPQKYTITAGSKISFWACAQDANYQAEHFGVAISTSGNTSAADFTTVSEWTIGAKVDAKGASRGDRDATPWVQYEVDLSAYAGQEVYVAIRHFNCYDQFILLLDDVQVVVGGGGNNQGGTSVAFGFEGGMEGWTTINANGDDHTWYHNSAAGDHSVLSADSHGGTGHLMSESYCNATWASMEPDDYVVSPEKYAITADSKVTFWACAQDMNYQAEHFGVAVSTAGNTSASDFTTISEWTIGAKVNAKGAARGDRDATPWVQYEVDLSAYAGQEAYIAIRHFNCYDQFILLVDDVEISAGGNGGGNDDDDDDDDPIDSMSWDFETGLDGWTNIDADGDAYAWEHNVDYGLTGDGAYGNGNSTGFVFSQSYDNWFGPLNPDNYLVSPSKIAVAAGSKISFYACAQDESYGAEHFGVAVSTGGNTSGSDFTTISEWTLATKGDRQGERGLRQSTWTRYEADLSAYAGQNVWVAIRHFNCTDQYFLDIDDIEITSGSKETREGTWAYYDDGTLYDGIGGPTSFSWGIKLRAADIEGYGSLTKVSIFDRVATSGTFDICLGGDDAPGASVHNQNYTLTGSNDFVEIALSEAVSTNGENVWIIFNTNDGVNYPASCCVNTGDADGRWIYLDGDGWFDVLTGAGLDVTWMIRGYFEEGGTGGGDDDEQQGDNATEPIAEILGVMIYKNGELVSNKPIEGTSYTDKNGVNGDEYCVKVVYGGAPDQTYYAMSNSVCAEADVTIDCVAPVDLFAEVNGDDVTLKLSYNPNPVGDWLYYDNGTNEDAIGGPAEFQWGIMFPSEVLAAYEGTSFTKVSLFDYAASSGDIKVYYGGTNAPQELVHSQPYSVSGTGAFVEFDLTAALPVDPTMNVWVTFTTSQGTSYPAAVCANTGDANGRWISLDGSVWEDIVDYGLSNTWMMRAYVTNAKGEVSSLAPIADEGFTATGGELAVAGAARATSELSHYNVYRGTSATNMEVIGEATTKTYVDENVAEGTYYYAMTAVYEEAGETCESDPANAYGSDETYVVVEVTAIDENGVEGMMVYPNPTKDNVTIMAEGIERITVTNALGQVMLDQVVNSDNEVLNMSQYEAGVYMVRIVTANGVAVERITVIK